MLTAYQCSTAAYTNEYGELFCDNEDKEDDDGYLKRWRAVSVYELDEWQTAMADGYYDGSEDEHTETCCCAPALYCEECGNELVEEYISPDCETKREESESDESDPAFD